METDPFRVAFFPDLGDQLIEEVMTSAVGADHCHAAAPGDAGISDGVQFAGIFVQGEFVQKTVAPLARLGIRATGHGVEAAPVGEPDDVSFGLVHNFHAQILHGGVDDPGERFAVIQEQPGLNLIPAGNPGVQSCARHAFSANQIVCARPGDPDLTGFFHEFQAGVVQHPISLVGEQQGIFLRFDLCFSHLLITTV